MKKPEDWVKAHYPISAETVAGLYERGKATLTELVQHSLTKWEGLRPEVLAEHGLKLDLGTVSVGDERNVLSVDSDSCSLCEVFWVNDYDLNENERCGECPLLKVRDGVRCDHVRGDELAPPFGALLRRSDPEPMIFWLQKALDHVSDPVSVTNQEPNHVQG